MGVPHSLHSTLVRIHSFWSLLSSSSTLSLKAFGTARALWKWAWASSLRVSFASADLNVPSLSSKTSEYLSSMVSRRLLASSVACEKSGDLMAHQSKRILYSQSFSTNTGPFPLTTYRSSSNGCWPLYSTFVLLNFFMYNSCVIIEALLGEVQSSLIKIPVVVIPNP